MNHRYDMRRSAVVDAVRRAGWFVGMKGSKLPVGEGATGGRLSVLNRRGEELWLEFRVLPNGVANRIQAMCPKCGTWMRFCGLKQHVGTETCLRKRRMVCQSIGLGGLDPEMEERS